VHSVQPGRVRGVGGPVCGQERVATQTNVHSLQSRLAAQLIEQRPGVLQVDGVEALGEPVVDLAEHCTRHAGRKGELNLCSHSSRFLPRPKNAFSSSFGPSRSTLRKP